MVDMTVNADTWLTERTVATHCHGAPNMPHTPFTSDMITMSMWNPLPFFRRRSGLSMINLERVLTSQCLLRHIGNDKVLEALAVP